MGLLKRKIVNHVAHMVGISVLRDYELEDFEALSKASSDPNGGGDRRRLAFIIFSMDRASQLDLLLRSYKECVNNDGEVTVLYRASTEEHSAAYQEVFSLHEDVIGTIVKQKNSEEFRTLLLGILDVCEAANLAFLVDDDVFKESLHFRSLEKYDSSRNVLSLRLGDHLRKAYTVDRKQPLPVLHDASRVAPGMVTWQWKSGAFDWGYVFSVDGNVFALPEIRMMVTRIQFNSPGSLENALGRFHWIYASRNALCFRKSVVVNVPLNKVQCENQNRHGGEHQDMLLRKWQDGHRIKYEPFRSVTNISAHQSFDIAFEKR